MSSTTNNFRRFIISSGDMKSGDTDQTNLMKYLLETKPQAILPTMSKMFSETQLVSTPLLDMALSGGKLELDGTSDSWTWDLALSSYNPAIVVENQIGRAHV